MIKTALQYLVGLGKAEIHNEEGQVYSDKPLHLIEESTASPLHISTLSGGVDYLKSEFDGNEPVIVHVESPTRVRVRSALNKSANRDYFIEINAIVPEFDFDKFYDLETLNVKLQSTFVETDERSVVLSLVGNVKQDDVRTYKDDGVSQVVSAKQGAQLINAEVPNPVTLKPYRTFSEIEQPESDFVFRLKNGPLGALFEADGGAWRIKAIDNIREFLELKLAEEIKNKRVTIIS